MITEASAVRPPALKTAADGGNNNVVQETEQLLPVARSSLEACWAAAETKPQLFPGLAAGDVVTSFTTAPGMDDPVNVVLCYGLHSGAVIVQPLDAFLAGLYPDKQLEISRPAARLTSHRGAVNCLLACRITARSLLVSGGADYTVKVQEQWRE